MKNEATQSGPVPAHALSAAFSHIRSGGRLIVPTYTRCTILDSKTLARFEKAGEWLLREDGEGYRLRSGKGSVYLMPGQLRFA
jgi:hypothetical protein